MCAIKKIMMLLLVLAPALVYAEGWLVISGPGLQTGGVLNVYDTPDTSADPVASLTGSATYNVHLDPGQAIYLQLLSDHTGEKSKTIEVYAPHAATEELYCQLDVPPMSIGHSLGIKLYGQFSDRFRDDVCNMDNNVFTVSTTGLIQGKDLPVTFGLMSNGNSLPNRPHLIQIASMMGM